MTRASTLPAPVRILFGVLKLACILLGLPLTVICLMALTGALTASGWARLAVGVLGGTLVPLFLVDRLLPEDTQRGQGLASDLLAIFFVGVPLLYAGAAQGIAQRQLGLEGDRLAAASWPRVAGLAYWLGGLEASTPPEAGAGSGSGSPARPDAGKAGGLVAARRDGGSRRDAGVRPDARRPDSAPSKLTPAEIFRRFAGSVVFIKCDRGGGTGFLIDEKGTIATNSHVIHGASEVEVKLKDGTTVREVELLVEDEAADLALLAIKGKLPPALRLGDSEKVVVGEPAVAIGNPLGLEHTLTDGLISARRVYRGKRWLQISVPLSPGNSGGPLFNQAGEVIGVNTARIGSFIAQNLNLAVPVSELKKLIKDSYPGRRSIGSASPGSW